MSVPRPTLPSPRDRGGFTDERGKSQLFQAIVPRDEWSSYDLLEY